MALAFLYASLVAYRWAAQGWGPFSTVVPSAGERVGGHNRALTAV